jgi:hypothetical protein
MALNLYQRLIGLLVSWKGDNVSGFCSDEDAFILHSAHKPYRTPQFLKVLDCERYLPAGHF